MLLTTRACTLDRNNAFALEEKMDVIAASLVSICAETADYTISQYEMCVGVGDFPLIKKQHEQKRRQKLKHNIAAASFLGPSLSASYCVSLAASFFYISGFLHPTLTYIYDSA